MISWKPGTVVTLDSDETLSYKGSIYCHQYHFFCDRKQNRTIMLEMGLLIVTQAEKPVTWDTM